MKKATFIVSLGLAVAVAIPLLAQAQTYTNPSGSASAQAMVPPLQSSCPQLSYNLTVGSRDYYTQGQVTALQRFLAARYAGQQSVTGYYGYMTAGNVARFQREQAVYPATGGVGPLTRAAIERTCGGTPQPTTGIFYLNAPFSLGQGQSSKEYAGTLEVTLTQIGISPAMTYPAASLVRITLGQSCPAGTYCAALYYPSQEFTLQPGQSATFQGYTVTLKSFASAAVFVVTKGWVQPPPTQGSLSGRVTVAPTCPVEYYAGQCPPSAYQTSVDVYQGGAYKQTVATDLDGKYTVQLAAGTYELRARGGQVYPVCPARTAVVSATATATADISCDSGIR